MHVKRIKVQTGKETSGFKLERKSTWKIEHMFYNKIIQMEWWKILAVTVVRGGWIFLYLYVSLSGYLYREKEVHCIMEDEKKIDVICQHSRDGVIIPIKIRLMDSDGQFQQYRIRGYRDVSRHKELHMPNGVTIVSDAEIKVFECRIQVLGQERTIRISYNQRDYGWRIVG